MRRLLTVRFSPRVLIMAPLGAQRRRPRGVVGGRVQPRGGRGGQGDHRRLRAGDRQAGRARAAVARMIIEAKVVAAVAAGQPPDFLFGSNTDYYYGQWAYEDRLVDLSDADRAVREPVRSGRAPLRDPARRDHRPARPVRAADGVRDHTMSTSGGASSSRRALPSPTFPRSGRPSGPSGAIGCSRRCARRRAATTSGASACPCRPRASTHNNHFEQFIEAYEANYVTREGKLIIDDPEIRQQADQDDRQLHRDLPQGLHAARLGRTGTSRGNNQAFLAQTDRHDAERDALDPQRAQARASGRLLREHRDDRMAAWRRRPDRSPSRPASIAAAVFKAGGHVPLAKEFVRFLVEEGWLAHYLDFSGERMHAADAEAARCAVLARPERPAPHACGDAVPDPPA